MSGHTRSNMYIFTRFTPPFLPALHQLVFCIQGEIVTQLNVTTFSLPLTPLAPHPPSFAVAYNYVLFISNETLNWHLLISPHRSKESGNFITLPSVRLSADCLYHRLVKVSTIPVFFRNLSKGKHSIWLQIQQDSVF